MIWKRAFSLLLALLPVGASAQTLHSLEGAEVPRELLGVYRLYPEPSARHMRSPLGYRPVYLTHYGRHGSRYVKYDSQYGHVRSVLAAADSAGALTPSGDSLWKEYAAIYPMLEGRTVQSMDAFCEGMLSVESGLDIAKESCRERMYCLNPYSSVSGTASEWDLIWNSPDAPSTPAKRRVAGMLVRVLYNEEDFKLPLKTVRRRFYRPADLLEFCRSKIAGARTVLGV